MKKKMVIYYQALMVMEIYSVILMMNLIEQKQLLMIQILIHIIMII